MKITIGLLTTSLLLAGCSVEREVSEVPGIVMSDENATHEDLTNLLAVYSVYDKNGPLELTRFGHAYDGGYVVSTKAFDLADAMVGYGIATDNSFEDGFSLAYDKPSFGFDCGVETIGSNSDLFTFVNECIGADSSLYSNQASSNQIKSYEQQLTENGLLDKNVFLKMDIEGSEYVAFSGIWSHVDKITGIVLEMHFREEEQVKRAVFMLRKLQESFVLVHVHGNNCDDMTFTSDSLKGNMPRVIELSFINKNLLTKYTVAKDQSHPLSMDMANCGGVDRSFEIVPAKK